MKDLLCAPGSNHFGCRRGVNGLQFFDRDSLMSKDTDFTHLTFDIGNNRALANMDTHGTIKNLTVFRSTYRTNESEKRGWPGVWLHKDYSCFGSYAYSLELDGETVNLADCDWHSRSGFIDNIFPVTELVGKTLKATLLCFAPISTDGSERLPGIVYTLILENTSGASSTGAIVLPDLFTDLTRLDAERNWITYRGDDFELELLEYAKDACSVPFSLQPGQVATVSAAIYQPGEPFREHVNAKGVVAWLTETWQYFRGMLGRMQTHDDPYYGEFWERNVLQCLQCVGMDADGFIAGSNWGTNPTHNAVWIKDMYYSCLPFAAAEPEFFKKNILWFAKYGVRHPGHHVRGGVCHSLSISLASLIMSGLYYTSTGDRSFFDDNPHLRGFFESVVKDALEARKDMAIFLFSSDYLSDGIIYGDWHTGVNICVWKALESLALLM
jgi:hypothetical protein